LLKGGVVDPPSLTFPNVVNGRGLTYVVCRGYYFFLSGHAAKEPEMKKVLSLVFAMALAIAFVGMPGCGKKETPKPAGRGGSSDTGTKKSEGAGAKKSESGAKAPAGPKIPD